MIEREVIDTKIKQHEIREYMANVVGKSGYSHTDIQKTPLGEKIIIYTSAPGLIVGGGGKSIKELTIVLRKKFGLKNPQIEVSEIGRPYLNPRSVARDIVNSFERFGPRGFKFTGYKVLKNIMAAGAQGAEIVITGRGIPSTRSRKWRFTSGHLKKSGNVAENLVSKGYAIAHLKSGAIGVKVSILTPDVLLPDELKIKKIEETIKEKSEENKKDEITKEKKVPTAKELVEKKETKEKKVPTAKELVEKK